MTNIEIISQQSSVSVGVCEGETLVLSWGVLPIPTQAFERKEGRGGEGRGGEGKGREERGGEDRTLKKIGSILVSQCISMMLLCQLL